MYADLDQTLIRCHFFALLLKDYFAGLRPRRRTVRDYFHRT